MVNFGLNIGTEIKTQGLNLVNSGEKKMKRSSELVNFGLSFGRRRKNSLISVIFGFNFEKKVLIW